MRTLKVNIKKEHKINEITFMNFEFEIFYCHFFMRSSFLFCLFFFLIIAFIRFTCCHLLLLFANCKCCHSLVYLDFRHTHTQKKHVISRTNIWLGKKKNWTSMCNRQQTNQEKHWTILAVMIYCWPLLWYKVLNILTEWTVVIFDYGIPISNHSRTN